MGTGRVLAIDAEGVVAVWHDGRVERFARAYAQASLRAGDLVRIGPDSLELLHRPADPLRHGHPEGEVNRLGADGGLRFRGLRERAVVLKAVRSFFDQQGFIEIEAPAMATCPGLEVHLDAIGVQLRQGMGGAPATRWLITSPEYHLKRLLVGGFERIYSLGRAFRSGERGPWHNPEFTMAEWYRTDARYPAIAADVHEVLRAAWRALEPLLSAPRRQELASLANALSQPAVQLPFRQALQEAGVGPMDEGDAEALVAAFVEHVEPNLPRDRVVIVDRWPISLASLARPFDDDPKTAERFEVYVCGVELANGFTELTDATEQRRRFERDLADRRRLGLPPYPIDERFLAALGEGCPPAAGVALGVDRMVMLLGGYDAIDQIIAFPFERA